MDSSWKACVLVIGPIVPLLTSITLAGFFDHSFFPDRPTWGLHYTLLGMLCLVLLIFTFLFIPVGLWCTVSQNHVVWAWTYFERDLWVREYSDATMVEYASTNGSAGGPVVTISYSGGEGERPTAKLKFRNLVDFTREEFGDLLAVYLGEPERRVPAPTTGNMFLLYPHLSSCPPWAASKVPFAAPVSEPPKSLGVFNPSTEIRGFAATTPAK